MTFTPELRYVGGYVDVECTDSDQDRHPAPARAPKLLTAGRAAILTLAAVASGAACFRAARPLRPGTHLAARPDAVDLAGFQQASALTPAKLPGNLTLLKPLENLHDGNPCDINEEVFGGLCYKSCAALTAGAAPIRSSSWTCCEAHPCTPLNQRGKVGARIMCTGFDISADGSCPHKPGACLVDEELFMGVCYKKCVDLTHQAFPHRTGAGTCCKTHGLGCLNPLNLLTRKELGVGGGAGDHDASTPGVPHPPLKSLTESDSGAAAAGADVASAPSSTAKLAGHAGFAKGNLAPVESLHDGNVCADNEELYGGLCYAKCAALTHGDAPIRTSSWTCCTDHPCLPWKQRGSIGSTLLCNGFDVSGDGACPHKPGACLMDEELHLGVCYKRCDLLTRGAFPHRTAPATCCKTEGLGCLNIRNDMTSRAFDVGGGTSGREMVAHAPEERLTERAAAADHSIDNEAGAAVADAVHLSGRRLRSAAA